jgi:uncharacterized membrane protein
MLLDILMFIVGMALILMGLQNFLNSQKRKVPTEVISATFMMIAGIFLVNFWYTSVSLSRGSTYNSTSYRV